MAKGEKASKAPKKGGDSLGDDGAHKVKGRAAAARLAKERQEREAAAAASRGEKEAAAVSGKEDVAEQEEEEEAARGGAEGAGEKEREKHKEENEELDGGAELPLTGRLSVKVGGAAWEKQFGVLLGGSLYFLPHKIRHNLGNAEHVREKSSSEHSLASVAKIASAEIGFKPHCATLEPDRVGESETITLAFDSKEQRDEWISAMEESRSPATKNTGALESEESPAVAARSGRSSSAGKKSDKKANVPDQSDSPDARSRASSSPRPETSNPSAASQAGLIAVFVGISDFERLACPRAIRLALKPKNTILEVLLMVAKKPSLGIDHDVDLPLKYALFRTQDDGGDRLSDMDLLVENAEIVSGSRLIFLDISTGDKEGPANESELFPKAEDGQSSQVSASPSALSIGESSPRSRSSSKGLISLKGKRRGSMKLDSADICGPRSVMKPLLEGLLMWREKKSKKFAKKWIVLDENHIHVFKGATDKRAAKTVLHLQTLSPKEAAEGSKKLIRLYTPAGEYDFHSESGSDDELAQWLKAIENAHFNVMNESLGSGAEKRDVLDGKLLPAEGPSSTEEEGKSADDAPQVEVTSMFSAPKRRAPTLAEVRQLEGNQNCADCEAEDTSWASLNLGVFLCIECCGAHRSLGSHITQMRSTEMDKWEQDRIEFMKGNGNLAVNKEYLAYVPTFVRKPDSETSMDERIQFARAKWEDRWFVARKAEA